jgi:hypothetical protein
MGAKTQAIQAPRSHAEKTGLGKPWSQNLALYRQKSVAAPRAKPAQGRK